VQPVAELSELSRRGGCDGRQVELAPANIRGGTLRRSGSLRFHQNTVSLPPLSTGLSVQLSTARSRSLSLSLSLSLSISEQKRKEEIDSFHPSKGITRECSSSAKAHSNSNIRLVDLRQLKINNSLVMLGLFSDSVTGVSRLFQSLASRTTCAIIPRFIFNPRVGYNAA